MTNRECREMIARTNLARLACSLDNQPYVVPIHVHFHDTYLYGFATLGQKIEWMRRNPRVCLGFDEITTRKEWVSVVVFGEYEELPEAAEFASARSVAEQLFQRHAAWWEPGSLPLAGAPHRSQILFRIVITRMTGRRAHADVSSDTLNLSIAQTARPPGFFARSLRRILSG